MGWAAAAIGLFTMGAGMLGASDQKDIDRETVELEYRDNLEKVRRRGFDMEQTKGAAKAFSENAGVLHTGGSTAQGYLDTMANEFRAELSWMKDYAKKARELGHERGSVNYDTNRFSAISSGMNAGMSIYGMGG